MRGGRAFQRNLVLGKTVFREPRAVLEDLENPERAGNPSRCRMDPYSSRNGITVADSAGALPIA